MQLKTNDGISCDYCGMKHSIDFTYFSFDFHHVHVHQNIRPSINQIASSPTVFSLDICQTCFDDIKKTIITNYAKNTARKGIICDWTNEILFGTFDYYYCFITEIIVKMSGQPYVCVGCGIKTFENQQCKNCGGVKFIKPADVQTNPRILEIIISDVAHSHFVNKLQETRKIISQWSTET